MPRMNGEKRIRRKRSLLYKSTKCHYCPKILDMETATLEHIVPFYLCQINRLWNLVLACDECNQKQGTKFLKCSCRRCERARERFSLLAEG
jgi:5-methylcytosine-specific restriction endonuclease McrA